MLARWTQIPATTKLDVCCGGRPEVVHLAVKGWGCGWLPAVLASKPGATWKPQYVVVAVEDSDVDHYLASVAAMSPSQHQRCSHVVWLGEQVTPEGFSRLLTCTQQPPLRLEVNGDAVGQLGPYVFDWTGCLELTARHFRALVGLSAARLVSLAASGCEHVADRDVAMLAGACHALKHVRMSGASKLTDLAMHSLAAGCRQLERLQFTHARFTEEGVVVALATLVVLQGLVLGGVPLHASKQLKLRVQQELAAAECRLWAVDSTSEGAEASLTWGRRQRGQ
jgi:hypothetical protein